MPILGYTLFASPLPIYQYWWLLLFPLCIAVSIVYKSIKCASMSTVPREAAVITLWILVGITSAAIVLSILVKLLER